VKIRWVNPKIDSEKSEKYKLKNTQPKADFKEIVDNLKHLPGALLPVLHAIQQQYGYIPDDSIAVIAQALNLSRAEVQGVISFYHDFKTAPTGDHTVHICRAEACQAMGARDLEKHAKNSLGVDYGETTEDGKITLEAAYCLGNCACSPSVRIDNRVYARVNGDRFDQLVTTLNGGSASD
jgi:formate dehydrogenase subunit gamma